MLREIKSDQNSSDYALKIKFEKRLARRMNKYFEHIISEVKPYYKRYGAMPNIDHFYDELEGILRPHYREVAKAFKKRLRLSLKKNLMVFDQKSIEDNIDEAINKYILSRAKEQAMYINATTGKDIVKAFEEVLMAFLISGQYLSLEELGEKGAEKFLALAESRSDTIGLTETNAMAEASKDIEANVLLDETIYAGGVPLRASAVTKTWSAILDKVTRPAHVEADDQTVPQDQPFIVDGEKLMYPGDTSLGASIENWINCRCNSTRAIQLAELPDYVYHPPNGAPTT